MPIQLRNNVHIITRKGKKLIVKKKRNTAPFEPIRFENEKRFYEAIEKADLKYLNVPSSTIRNDKILLKFIERGGQKDLNPEKFIKSYLELQKLQPKDNFLLENLVQLFQGFHYRVCIVTIFTIRKII